VSRTDGFARVPDWVTRHARPALGMSPADLAAYVVLVSRSNAQGITRPSYPLIAWEAGMSETTAAAAVKRLLGWGLVEVVEPGRQNHATVYRLVDRPNLPPVPERPLSKSERRARTRRPQAPASWESDDAASAQAPSARAQAPSTRVPGLPEPGSEVDTEVDTTQVAVAQRALGVRADRTPDAGYLDAPTPAQVTLLQDLHILSGLGIPEPVQVDDWARLTSRDATALIALYRRDMGRGGGYAGPWAGDDDYDALSAEGQRWSDAAMAPQDLI
jgi:hypothetical protein